MLNDSHPVRQRVGSSYEVHFHADHVSIASFIDRTAYDLMAGLEMVSDHALVVVVDRLLHLPSYEPSTVSTVMAPFAGAHFAADIQVENASTRLLILRAPAWSRHAQ